MMRANPPAPLTYVNTAMNRPLYISLMVDSADFIVAARAAIEMFGENAALIMERRAEAHKRAGETAGEQYWRGVAETVRAILAGYSK